MKGKFLFLGTGSSVGVPVIGCDCEVCKSDNKKNVRFRPSGLIHLKEKTILIDIGPDFRQQALLHNISHIDGILITHTHYDHIAGIDDLRIFYFLQKEELPCLLSKESYFELRQRFRYLFRSKEESKTICAQLHFTLLEKDAGQLPFQGIPIRYFSFYQGDTKVTGYKIGRLGYVSDICQYPQEIFSHLEGVHTLILSALRPIASKVHFSIDQAIAFAQKVGAKTTYFTHIAHEVDHEKVESSLPENIHLSYDGLEIEFEC